jgi:hypothetical protein
LALAETLSLTRQYPAAEQAFERAIELVPDQPMLEAQKALGFNFQRSADTDALRSAIAALPASMANSLNMVNWRLILALIDRDWQRATELIQQMNGSQDGAISPTPIFRFRSIATPFWLRGSAEICAVATRVLWRYENS